MKTGFQNPVGAISESRPVGNPNQRYECLLAFPGVPSYKENQLITNQQILFRRYALQTRCIKASTSLNAYLDWPGIAQVFQYRYTYKNLNTGEETHKVQYGITSLNPDEALAKRLLALRRRALVIENKSH